MRAAIVSVHYADLLAVTLPAWVKLLPPGVLSVVTSPADHETQEVSRAHGVPVVVTDAWTRTDPSVHTWGLSRPVTFNCALALDVALGLAEDARARPSIGEVIAAIHVDCYPQGRFCDLSLLKTDTLYGVWRHHCQTPQMFKDVLTGSVTRQQVRRMKNSGGRPVGYFQMCRYRAGLRFGSYPTAQKYDTHFCAKFATLAFLDDFWLWHLGPQDDANWAGRILPRWESVA